MFAMLPAMFLGLLGLLAVVVMWAIGVYNRLVKLKVRCEDAWASIDVQLKRRYDLIPNLVETVKGYASHERETLEAVIAARQAGIDANNVQDQAQAENLITGALRQLFALSEAYPDLKANENMMQLSEELTTTENKVAFARQAYNDSVMDYNTLRESFPNNFFAGWFNFQAAELLEIEDEAKREVPKVSF